MKKTSQPQDVHAQILHLITEAQTGAMTLAYFDVLERLKGATFGDLPNVIAWLEKVAHGKVDPLPAPMPGSFLVADMQVSDKPARRKPGRKSKIDVGDYVDTVVKFLQKNPGARAEAIREGTGIERPVLQKVIKSMLAEGTIKVVAGQKRATEYGLTGGKSAGKPASKPKAVKKPAKKAKKTPAKAKAKAKAAPAKKPAKAKAKKVTRAKAKAKAKTASAPLNGVPATPPDEVVSSSILQA